MKWTSKKPEKEGWYWYQDEHFGAAPILVEYADSTKRFLEVSFPIDECFVPRYESANGKWAGPLELPED